MTVIAKGVIIVFGLFLIGAGFIMLFAPEKARAIVRKAGSTNFINYAELIIRMIPAAAFILYAEHSAYPGVLKYLGWFMLVSSLFLCLVPRQLHHRYALKCAEILKPFYFRLISPFSFLFGFAIIYSVL